jgi:hypothetical protein
MAPEPQSRSATQQALDGSGLVREHFSERLCLLQTHLARDLEHSLGPAGPIRWAISASVDIAMNFSASLVERTIVAVDYFINRAISGAWESICRSALGYKRQQPLPEEDYGGGDICSLEETHSTEDDQPLE